MSPNEARQTFTETSGASVSQLNAHARSAVRFGFSGASSRFRVIETKRSRSSGDERVSAADAGVSPQTKARPSAPINWRAHRNPILLFDIRTSPGDAYYGALGAPAPGSQRIASSLC